MMKNLLEIILITYNRASDLKRTLQALFEQGSPVRDVSITVLDNHSTDQTPQILQDFAQNHANLHIISRPKNIGSNANIARAFELAKAPYIWVLCDDDDLNWQAWPEVAQAMQNNADAIVVNTETDAGKNLNKGKIYRLVTFLPSVIYKTSLLDETVLLNMYNYIPTWFPHLAAMAKVFNVNGKIVITSSDIVTAGKNSDNSTIKLGKKENIQNKTLPLINQILDGVGERSKNQCVELGYLQACDLIENPQVRAQAVDSCMSVRGFSFPHALRKIIRNNWKLRNGYLGHLISAYCVFNWKQKLTFLGLFLLSLLSVPKYKIAHKKHCKKISCYKKHFKTDVPS